MNGDRCTGLKDCRCEQCEKRRHDALEAAEIKLIEDDRATTLADLYKRARSKGLVRARSDYH